MTTLTPREMLDAFDRGLQAASREVRRKHGNTLIKALRKTYGDEFAAGYRSNTKLQTVLEREGFETLEQYLARSR